jgi:hypothetical protein
MRFPLIRRFSILQLVVMALLAVIQVEATDKVEELDPVDESLNEGIPKCSRGCAKNRKGQWVCRMGGQIIICPSTLGPLDDELEPADAYTSENGPKSQTTLDDKEDVVAEASQPTDVMYFEEDLEYEYGDLTVVPVHETPPAPVPLPSPTSPNPARKLSSSCTQGIPTCSSGCKAGRCCSNGKTVFCKSVS